MSNPNTRNTDRNRPWLDGNGYLLRRLPAACIEECSGPGERAPATRHWVRRLKFDVPREVAVRYLTETGGWDRAELADTDSETLAMRCLWLMACDAREMRAQGEANAQPFGVCL